MNTALYIPTGVKNLKSMFPTVNFDDVKEYYIELIGTDNSTIATTPKVAICDCAADEKVRIHFLNYLGTWDAINFLKPKITHDDTASEFQNGQNYPLQKTDFGIERFNVKSNDTYEARMKCLESDMLWLQECADSPRMLMEWNGTEGQPDGYIPVVKIAGKMDKLKTDQEYDYELIIQFKLSNEFIVIRN